MEFGWFHDDEGTGALSELNITPLVDVALVLLIIFMITAPLLVQGANVNLPQTQPMDKLPSGNVHVIVTAEGQVFMNDETEPLEPAELEERIYPLAQLGQAVYLQGDAAVNYGRVIEVLDAVKSAGAQINLVTLPKPPASR